MESPQQELAEKHFTKLLGSQTITNTVLNMAMAIDLIDKQNVEFAKATFSSKVVKALKNVGAKNEANFCSLVFNW